MIFIFFFNVFYIGIFQKPIYCGIIWSYSMKGITTKKRGWGKFLNLSKDYINN